MSGALQQAPSAWSRFAAVLRTPIPIATGRLPARFVQSVLLRFLGLTLLLGIPSLVWSETDSATAITPQTSGLLDGQRFGGTVGAIGKVDPYTTDSIEFVDGQFASVDCSLYGFAPAPYYAERDGESVRFRAVITSPTHGTMIWEGTIEGDTALASYRWTRERWLWTQRGEYWFKGLRSGARTR